MLESMKNKETKKNKRLATTGYTLYTLILWGIKFRWEENLHEVLNHTHHNCFVLCEQVADYVWEHFEEVFGDL